MTQILMPKATAVWLIDNTSLTFEQIAEFCGLHPLEVKGIADGDVAVGVRGADPISNGQLTREEIERAEADQTYRLSAVKPKYADLHKPVKTRGPRYTPLSRRQTRPDAIAWLVRNHPELTDAQISKLIGTTKTTIAAVRDRTHWNAANIKPTDPVSLGLCSQIDLDEAVRKSSGRRKKMEEERAENGEDALVPADTAPEIEEAPAKPAEIDLETLFGGKKD
ncbi:MAG: DUF1013 domain-containing protein [Maricaulaceae bacterium]|nr:DUF1013 domain-containing protein [Maricaulaceae bacterium]